MDLTEALLVLQKTEFMSAFSSEDLNGDYEEAELFLQTWTLENHKIRRQ